MKFELDCASTLFVLGRNDARNYKIRFAIHLHEPIDEAALQSALSAAVKKYPYFFLRFVRGFSHLYAEPTEYAPRVTRAGINSYRQLYEAQVSCCGNTIFLEYSHFITDGRGGLEFLVYLTAEYLSRKHPGTDFLRRITVPSVQEQSENGYYACGKGLQGAGRRGRAYQIKGTPLGCAVTPKSCTYRLSASEIRQLAKDQQVSVTELMSALLCIAIWGVWKEHSSEAWPTKIRLSVPVDLRPRFSCHTMRNFSLNVYPEANPAKDDMILSALCEKFHRYMADATEQKRLAGRCTLAERIGNGPLIRALPFSWKRKLVQAVQDLSFTGSTMTFSNLGIVRFPEGMAAHVAGLELAFSPKPESPYSCSMLTVDDELRLTLLRSIHEPLLEAQLETVFQKQNIHFATVL